jgi:hypothetical protein
MSSSGLLVTTNVVVNSLILFALMAQSMRSPESSVRTRGARRHDILRTYFPLISDPPHPSASLQFTAASTAPCRSADDCGPYDHGLFLREPFESSPLSCSLQPIVCPLWPSAFLGLPRPSSACVRVHFIAFAFHFIEVCCLVVRVPGF